MRPLAIVLICLVACREPDAAPKAPVNRAQALVDAARAGDTVGVAALLHDGLSPDTLAPDGKRPLAEAARNGRVAVARQLLAADARLDLKDSVGYLPWDYAIESGREQVAALLTWQAAQVAGASPKAIEWFAAVATPSAPLPAWDKVLDGELESLGLLYAAILNRSDVVSALRHGGGIPNRTGITPLAMAARFGRTAAVEALLAAGANPDLATTDRWQSTPLMEAARDGRVEIGRALLQAGARVDHKDLSGGTALHWAVRAGETKFARMLLESGADMNLSEWSGDRPLDIARRIDHPDLINLLESWRGIRR
jgi:ankyrin repeat protein